MASDKLSPVLEGVKHGAVKKAVDLAVDPFAGPIADGIRNKWNITNPTVSAGLDAGVRFVVMLGIAEAIQVLGPAVGKDEKWVNAITEYVRIYAGEKLGADGLEAALRALPEAFAGLSSLETEDIKGALEAHGALNNNKVSSLFDLEELAENVGEPTDGENNE